MFTITRVILDILTYKWGSSNLRKAVFILEIQ